MRIAVIAAALISAAPLVAAEYPPMDTERMAKVCRDYAGPETMTQNHEAVARLSDEQLEQWRQGKLLQAMRDNNVDPRQLRSVDIFCQMYVAGVEDSLVYAKQQLALSR